MWDGAESLQDKGQKSKEPTTGFQLFASRPQSDAEILEQENKIFGPEIDLLSDNSSETKNTSAQCISKFDFTRIEGVRSFSVIYMVQGRSWYTKWLTVLEKFPIFTRFKTFDFTDLGGSLNIRVSMDTGTFNDPSNHLEEGFYHVITGCLSKGRQPRVISTIGVMSCDNHGATLKVADLDPKVGNEALKIIPFPEPGLWYIGFQLSCRNISTGGLIKCPESSVSAMVSVDVNIQPCDHRPLQNGKETI